MFKLKDDSDKMEKAFVKYLFYTLQDSFRWADVLKLTEKWFNQLLEMAMFGRR